MEWRLKDTLETTRIRKGGNYKLTDNITVINQIIIEKLA